MARRKRARRGVALIMVLGALTVLTVMLTEFQNETSAELGSSIAQRDALKAEYAARSAINLSRLLIAAEPTIRKPISFMLRGVSQIKVWEYAGPVLSAFNDAENSDQFSALASVNLAEGKNLGMEGAGFEVTIVDEDAKLNVNRAAVGGSVGVQQLSARLITLLGQPQYATLFEGEDADGQVNDPQTICAAIVDWVDPNQDAALDFCNPLSETAQQTVPEDTFYQQLDQPYFRKNAPFDSLEELRMVRGVNEDFWFTFVDPDPAKPDKRNWTVWGGSQINVNSATADLIWGLACDHGMGAPEHPICTDPEQAVKFLTSVGMVRNLMPGVPAFKSPKDFINALKGKGMFSLMVDITGLEPFRDFKSESTLESAVTTESKVFSVYATGYAKAGKRETRMRIHTVVDFRAAPAPGMPSQGRLEEVARMAEDAGFSAAADELRSAAQNMKAEPPEGAGDNAILSAFRPSPAGNIVYFRID
jgi:general secretion pathway protein K